MKKLSASEHKQKAALAARLRERADDLEDAIIRFNDKVHELYEPVAEAQEAFNEAINDANGFIQDIHSQQEDYVSERSDKWQESDAASEYESWSSDWDYELSEAQVDPCPEIEVPENSDIDMFEDLPEEVNS